MGTVCGFNDFLILFLIKIMARAKKEFLRRLTSIASFALPAIKYRKFSLQSTFFINSIG
jgi:hypothetical protein